ncbi:hypothetical protein [Oceanihabitans sediminis]|uniref:hypothetical protein n=1 Tax=Oceanihabitans sediminis TaxID=1812012 RepID=UPI00299D8BD0|nr:hypothetical protein [Oceanihabitans sediminis]MDX1279422.1 hypothetical protein [Oceanihabitans sediminis]
MFTSSLHAQFNTYGFAAYTINENAPYQVYTSTNPSTSGGNTWIYIGNLNNGSDDLPGRARDCIVIGDNLYVVYNDPNNNESGVYIYDLNSPSAGVQPLGIGLFGSLNDGRVVEKVNGITRTEDNIYYGVSGNDFIFAFDITTGQIVPDAFGGNDHIDLVMAPGSTNFTIGTNEDMGYNTCEDKVYISASFGGGGNGDDWVASVDLTNGQVTPEFATKLDSDGLAFDSDGNLFTSNRGNFYYFNGTELIKIDQVTSTNIALESLGFVLDAAPVAHDDSLEGVYCASETVVINPLENDVDFENNLDPTTVQVSNVPTGVAASVNTVNGEISLTFTPGFSGDIQFNYTVKDTKIGNCDIAEPSNMATISLSVNTGTDTDGDGIVDSCDLDNDNDGILDIDECPFVDSGKDGAYKGTEYTMNITSPNRLDHTANHILESIEVEGGTYNYFIVPDVYVSSFSGVNSNGKVYITDHGTQINDYNNNPNFDNNALPAFQSADLNLYHSLDGKNYTQDSYTVSYNNPIVSNRDIFIAVTERTRNNRYFIEALDSDNNVLGNLTVIPGDYVNTNHKVHPSGAGFVFVGLFQIDDLAPVGSEISALRVSFTSAATSDGPDGKILIFGDFAKISCDTDLDGIPDYLDTDSDNDGCFDALEAAGNITTGQLDTNGMITGNVDENGVPIAVSGGQSTTAAVTINEKVTISSITSDVSGAICSGTTITYIANATGTRVTDFSTTPYTTEALDPSEINYQWYESTDGGTTFTILSGKTNNTLTLSNVQVAAPVTQYKVLASSANNSCGTEDTTSLTVVNEADLSLEKTVYADQNATGAEITQANIGDTIYYKIVLTNNGPCDATASVKDVLPAGVSYIATSSTVPASTSFAVDEPSNIGMWNNITVTSGSTQTLVIAVLIGPNCGDITNFAEVETSSRQDPNSTPGNNQ